MPLIGNAEGIVLAGLLLIMIGMTIAGIYLYFKKDKVVGAFMIMEAFVGICSIGAVVIIMISTP